MIDTPTDTPLELGALYRAHHAQVVRWVSRLGGPRVDVDDLAHEVFLTARPLLPGFRPRTERSVSTWLYRITENLVRRQRRRDRWRAFFIGGGRGGEDVVQID